MDLLEQTFAAAIFHARHDPDAIEDAWFSLWIDGRALERDEDEISAIASRWLEWDGDEPRARAFGGNVVALPHHRK